MEPAVAVVMAAMPGSAAPAMGSHATGSCPEPPETPEAARMSRAASGESVLGGFGRAGAALGGVGGLRQLQCSSPMDMGAVQHPLLHVLLLPEGLITPVPRRGTGCSEPVLSPGEGMEPETGWCWAGSRLGTRGEHSPGYQGSIHTPWQHPPSMAQPRVPGHHPPSMAQPGVPGQHPPTMARGSSTEWGQRGHPCVSRLGPSQAVLFHPWMSWSLSSLRPVPCPHLCQAQQLPNPLGGVVGAPRACGAPSVPSSAAGMDTPGVPGLCIPARSVGPGFPLPTPHSGILL